MEKQFLSLNEMAAQLNRCGKTFAKYVRKYDIPHIRLGRDMLFDPERVIAFLEERQARSAANAPQPLKRRRVMVPTPDRRGEFAGILSAN